MSLSDQDKARPPPQCTQAVAWEERQVSAYNPVKGVLPGVIAFWIPVPAGDTEEFVFVCRGC